MGMAGRGGLAVVLLVVGSVTACGAQGSAQNSVRTGGGAQGLQVKHTVNELGRIADLVVVGVAKDPVIEPFSANQQIPTDARDEAEYADGRYTKTQITVVNALKGDPPKNLTTAQLHSLRRSDGSVDRVTIGGGGTTLRRGVRYVLFLIRGDALWAGHYLPLPGQGVGVVEGDLVRFDSGETLQMDELLSQFQAQVPPPTANDQ